MIQQIPKLGWAMLFHVLLIVTPSSALSASSENACAISRAKRCDIALAVQYGMIETGLRPVFPKGARCRKIDGRFGVMFADGAVKPAGAKVVWPYLCK